MVQNPIIHALIIVALSIALATLAAAALYQVVTGAPRDPNIGMSILALLALLQGYVKASDAIYIARNGNGN